MLQTITAADLNDAFALFGLNDEDIFSSLATSGPAQPMPAPALKMQATGKREPVSASQGTGKDVTETMLEAMARAMMRAYNADAPKK
jgi:hypothetical protein